MPLDFHTQPSQGAPVTRSVQSVQPSLDARGGDGSGEPSAAQATDTFHRLFAGLTERWSNQRIVEAAQWRHDADGVLRCGGESSEKGGEHSDEGRVTR